MKPEFLIVFYPLLFCGQYDFDIWYGLAKEQSGIYWEKYYRLAKETIDLIIIPALLHYYYGWSWNLVSIYYIMKLFGWADAIYILIAKLFNHGKIYIDGPMWWLWWTPLGLFRSSLIYSIDLSTFKSNEYFHLFRNWYFLKGTMTKKEFNIQLAIGLIISYIIYHFNLISYII